MNRGNFSGLLQKYMERRKISRRELAEGTQLGDIVYKYVKGTRNVPATGIIDKIADFLQCTPQEREELLQAWRVDTYGTQRLERWKHLDHFFAHYTLDLSAPEGYSFQTSINKTAKPWLFLHNELEVHQAILALIDNCARSEDNGNESAPEQTFSAANASASGQSTFTANGLMRLSPENLGGGYIRCNTVCG